MDAVLKEKIRLYKKNNEFEIMGMVAGLLFVQNIFILFELKSYVGIFMSLAGLLFIFYDLNKKQGNDLNETIKLLKENLKQMKKEKRNPKKYIKEKFLHSE